MREVAYYCIIDALHCQELLVNQSIINDYRKVVFIAYVSLFDTHYRTNGMKVQNFFKAYAVKRDIVISTWVPENIEKGKYPDAYVFPPKKGIKSRRPITGLDFALLYFSIIMAYNLFPEKFIFDPNDVNIAQNNRNNLHKIEFSFNNYIRLELKARLASDIHFQYPKYFEIVSHYVPKCLTLSPSIPGKKKQHLKKMISSAKESGKRIPERLNLKYSSVCFDYDYWDSKQKALKDMNTFYREAKNLLSPIFLHRLACRTTIAGKYILNLVAEFVSKKDRYYEKCNEAFSREELSKETYWTEMREDNERGYGYKYIRPIHIIVKDTLREAENKKWNFNEFIIIGTWSTKKENLCNNHFMKRMRERNKRILDPSEQFSYVVMKGPCLRNEKGRLILYRIGNYMKYL
ncbi:12181_t:CDS:2 [Funneliformis geosporum]|nr:12181_t:CDS:2 [Funneliformis geosporum]